MVKRFQTVRCLYRQLPLALTTAKIMPTASVNETISELLGHLGVHSSAVEVVVAGLVLLGAIAGGVSAVIKLLKGASARLTASGGEGKRKLRRRSAFARFVESRIRDLDNKEEWSDQRFAELEAEVETEGVRQRPGWLRLRRKGLRRERSLSRALMVSKDQLILLQGDPGSGKSVALRYVARTLAQKAIGSKRLDSIIPLYINLKGLQRDGAPVDATLIESYVLSTLRDGAAADVERYLDTEFEKGKIDGTWLFLFDSFDEIPELLNSTEAEGAVAEYSEAISDFVHGVSICRAVIASRHFRAPPRYGMPTFTIVPLSDRRRRDLIRKADLEPKELDLLATLPGADAELVALSGNPMFLGLLIEYVRERQAFPSGWYDVFEDFIARRLDGYDDRLQQRFNLSAEALRRISEELAFTMTATVKLGLSPRRSELKVAYLAQGFGRAQQLESAMDALQWTKLARSEEGQTSGIDPTFTFSHRRFQEYFATNVVLGETHRVEPKQLLSNASWRETAVTLCQSNATSAATLLTEAGHILSTAAQEVTNRTAEGAYFTWPKDSLHLLGLLQTSFAGTPDRLPESLRADIRILLGAATETGTITDHKWALEVAGTAPVDQLATLLLAAFNGPSKWLREVAYRQAARLPEIPEALGREIRRALVDRMVAGHFMLDWPTTRAQILRLRPRADFIGSARVLRLIPLFDSIACVFGFTAVFGLVEGRNLTPKIFGIALLLLVSLYPSLILVSRLRQQRLRTSGLFRFLLVQIAAEGRTIGTCAPLIVACKVGDPVTIACGAAVTYALAWSPAAALLAINSPDHTAFGWCAAPVLLLPNLFRRIKLPSIRQIAIAALGALVLGAVIFGMARIPHSLGQIVTIAFIGLIGLLVALSVLLIARREFIDYIWLRRWSRRHGRSISVQDFLDSLAVLRGASGMERYLRQVRAQRLLEGDEKAREVLNALLLVIRPEPPEEVEAEDPTAQIPPVLAAWMSTGSDLIPRLERLGVEDALGQLLEDIDAKTERPVA
jgi:hypothetical protein